MTDFKNTIAGFTPAGQIPPIARRQMANGVEAPFHVKSERTSSCFILEIELYENFQSTDIRNLFQHIKTFKLSNDLGGVVINANHQPLIELDQRAHELIDLRTAVYNATDESLFFLKRASNKEAAKKLIIPERSHIIRSPGMQALHTAERPHWEKDVVRVSTHDGNINDENIDQVKHDLASCFSGTKASPIFINLVINSLETNNSDFTRSLNGLLIRLNNNNGYLAITCRNDTHSRELEALGYRVFRTEKDAEIYLAGVRDHEIIPPPPNSHFNLPNGIKPPSRNGKHFKTTIQATDIGKKSPRLEKETSQLLTRPVSVLWEIATENINPFPSSAFINEIEQLNSKHRKNNGRSTFICKDPLVCEMLIRGGITAYADEKLADKSLEVSLPGNETFSPPVFVYNDGFFPVFLTNIMNTDAPLKIPDWEDIATTGGTLIINITGSSNIEKASPAINQLSKAIKVRTFITANAEDVNDLFTTVPVFLDTDSIRLTLELNNNAALKNGLDRTSILEFLPNEKLLIVKIPDGIIGQKLMTGSMTTAKFEDNLWYLDRTNYRMAIVLPADSPDTISSNFIRTVERYTSTVVCKNQKALQQFPATYNKFTSLKELERNAEFLSYAVLKPQYISDDVIGLGFKVEFPTKSTNLILELGSLPHDKHLVINLTSKEHLAPALTSLATDLRYNGKQLIIIHTEPGKVMSAFLALDNVSFVDSLEEGLRILNSTPIEPPENGWQEVTEPRYARGVYITSIENENSENLTRLDFELDYLSGQRVIIKIPNDLENYDNIVGVLKKYNTKFVFYCSGDPMPIWVSKEPYKMPLYSSLDMAIEHARKLELATKPKQVPEPKQTAKAEEKELPIAEPRTPPPPRAEINLPESGYRFGEKNDAKIGTIALSENNTVLITLDDNYNREENEQCSIRFTQSVEEILFLNNNRQIIVNLNWRSISLGLAKKLIDMVKKRNVDIIFCNSLPNSTLGNYGVTIYPSIQDGRNALIEQKPTDILGNSISKYLEITTYPPARGINYAIIGFSSSANKYTTAGTSEAIENLSFRKYPYPYVILDLSNFPTIDKEVLQAIRFLDLNAGAHNVRVGVIRKGAGDLGKRVNNPEIQIGGDLTEVESLLKKTISRQVLKPTEDGFMFFQRPRCLKGSKDVFAVKIHPANIMFPDDSKTSLEHDAETFRKRNIVLDIRGEVIGKKLLAELNNIAKDFNGLTLLTLDSNLDLSDYPNLNIALSEESAIKTFADPETFKYELFEKPLSNSDGTITLHTKNRSLKLSHFIKSPLAKVEFAVLKRAVAKAKCLFYELNAGDAHLRQEELTQLKTLYQIFGDKLRFIAQDKASREWLKKFIDDEELPEIPVYKSRNEASVYISREIVPTIDEISSLSVEETLKYETASTDTLILSNFASTPNYKEIFNTLLDFIYEGKDIVYVLPAGIKVPLDIEGDNLLAQIKDKCELHGRTCRFVLDPTNQDKYRLLKIQLQRFDLELHPNIASAI